MQDAHIGHSWDIGICMMSTYDGSGFLGVQYDAEGSLGSGSTSGAASQAVPPNGGAADYEVIMPGGLMHRPMDPAVDGNGNPNSAQAAQVLNLREAGRVFAMPLGDPRSVAILPTIANGSTLLYSDCGSFVRLEGSGAEQGQISLFTTDDGTTDGYSVGYQVYPTGFSEIGPWGKRTFDLSGHEMIASSGARLTLGYAGGLPGPLAALSAMFAVMADTATLDASYVNLGRSGALGRGAAVRADFLQRDCISVLAKAVLDLQTAVLALAAAPVALGPSPAVPFATNISIDVPLVTALASPVLTPLMTWPSSGVVVS